jgi:hypothetical protein
VFFGRLFENEAFSSSRAAASGLIWLLALIATPGVMFSFLMSLHYSHLLSAPRFAETLERSYLSHQTLFVDVAMAVAVVAITLVWNSLTPDRKDVMVLGSLPVTPAQQARARLLAIATFVALFVVAMSGPTSIAFTLFSRSPAEILNAPRYIAGHMAATGLGAVFVFFVLVNVQLLLAAAFGPRAIRLTTLPLQAGALVAVVAAIALGEGTITEWNPAAWFVGLYRYIGGDDRPLFAMLAQRAIVASAINLAVVVALYPLAYGRCLRNVIAHEGRTTTRMSRGWARLAAMLLRPLLRHPLQRGLAAFMLATLSRSHTHRFIVGAFGGLAFLCSLPLAARLVRLPATADDRYVWFAIPLGFVFWLVCGVRVALMMPVEPVANWIFKLTEPVDKRRLLAAVVTLMATITVLPIASAFSGALSILGEQRLAVTVLLVVSLAGLGMIELVTLTMKTVPFSCTYLPGQLKLRYYWAPYFFLWLNFVFTLSTWSLWALDSWWNTAQLCGALLAVWVLLRAWHMARASRLGGFVYEQPDPPVVVPILGA